MRRLAAFLGIAFAGLLGWALYVSAQPTGGTAPPFPFNPARWKEPSSETDLDQWWRGDRFSIGDFEGYTKYPRMTLDYFPRDEGTATPGSPLDQMLRLESPSTGSGNTSIGIWPQPLKWRRNAFYGTTDIVQPWPTADKQYQPEAACTSGTTMPMSSAAFTGGWVHGRWPRTFYPNGARLSLLTDNDHKYRVTNASGCWTGGHTGAFWVPDTTYCITGGCAVTDGTCSLLEDGSSTVNNVADGACVWDEQVGDQQGWLGNSANWLPPMVEIGSLIGGGPWPNHGPGVVVRGYDNSVGPFFGRRETINSPIGNYGNGLIWGVLNPDPRQSIPAVFSRGNQADGVWNLQVNHWFPGFADPWGQVELTPYQGSHATPLTSIVAPQCWYVAYAFEDRIYSGQRTSSAPVYAKNGVFLDGAQGAAGHPGACNPATGATCDALRATIREPVPDGMNLVLYTGFAACGTTSGAVMHKPPLMLRWRVIEDPAGAGTPNSQAGCKADGGSGTPCVVDVETYCVGGSCENETANDLNLAQQPLAYLGPGDSGLVIWAPSTVYARGQFVRPTDAKRNGLKYYLAGNSSTCTGGSAPANPCPNADWQDNQGRTCTSAGSEPAWPTEQRDYFSDNNCLWVTAGVEEATLVLLTDGSGGDYLQIKEPLSAGAPTIAGWATDGDHYFKTGVSGGQDTLRVDRATGEIQWSSGAAGAALDTNLKRSGVGTLRMDGGRLEMGSGQSVVLDHDLLGSGQGGIAAGSGGGTQDTIFHRCGTDLWCTGDDGIRAFASVAVRNPGNSQDRCRIDPSLPGLSCGSGTSTADAFLYRAGAGAWAAQGSGSTSEICLRNSSGINQWCLRKNASDVLTFLDAASTAVASIENGAAARGLHIDSVAGGGVGINMGAASTIDNGTVFEVQHAVGTPKGARPWPVMTETERDLISSPTDGGRTFIDDSGKSERVDERAAGAWIPASAPKGDVRRFGAKCDGTTNDTAAFQAAADAGGKIFVDSGTCLTDQIDITNETHWILHPEAVIQMRSINVSANYYVLRFAAGSAGSSVEGGTIDGRASVHAASYPDGIYVLWAGVRVDGVSRISVKHVRFTNFVGPGIYVGSGNYHTLEDVTIEDSLRCLIFQNSEGSTIRDFRCDDIVGASQGTYQHANEVRDSRGLTIDGFTITGYQPDDANLDPVPNAIEFNRMKDSTISNLSVYDYLGTDPDGANCIGITDGLRLRFTGLYCLGFSNGLGLQGVFDSTVSDFMFDGAYAFDPDVNDWPGIYISPAAVYPQAGSQVFRGVSSGRNLTISNGIVTRFELGVLNQSSFVNFDNVRAIGNVRDGFQFREFASAAYVDFQNPATAPSTDLSLSNCVATRNGSGGLRIGAGVSRLNVVGGDFSDNGQCVPADRTCSGMSASTRSGFRADAGNGFSVDGARLRDNQTWTRADAISFEPGTATSSTCVFPGDSSCTRYTVSLVNPHEILVGQLLTLKNVTGAADKIAQVVALDRDEATVEFTEAVTLSATGNLTNLVGTFTSSGNVVTGVAGGAAEALDTEIVGRTYIQRQSGGEWRRVVRVDSASSAIIDVAFTTPLAGEALRKLTIDVDAMPSQQYGFSLAAGVLAPLSLLGADLTGNLLAPLDDLSGSQSFIVSDLQPAQFPTINAAATITLPAEAGFIDINGTTTITSIANSYKGRLVTLKFNGAITITDGSNLKMGGSFSADADDTLTFRMGTASWFEVSRSVN